MKVYRRLHAIEAILVEQRTWRQRLYLRHKTTWFYRTASARFGADINPKAIIPDSVSFGHGLLGLTIAGGVVIGENVTIYHHVTLAWAGHGVPRIGDGVFIGVGATIVGSSVIGDRAKIGAGVVLVDAIIPPDAVIVNRSAYDVRNDVPVYPTYKAPRRT